MLLLFEVDIRQRLLMNGRAVKSSEWTVENIQVRDR